MVATITSVAAITTIMSADITTTTMNVAIITVKAAIANTKKSVRLWATLTESCSR